MSTTSKRANNVSQNSGNYNSTKKYKAWTNIGNLKKSSPYATCKEIATKSGTSNRPAQISLKNFKFQLPAKAKVTKIIVHYHHYRVKYGGTYGSFKAPTISLLNTTYSKTGNSLPTKNTAYTTEFNVSLTGSQVNNSNFGVKFNYPANTSTNVATLTLGDVYLEAVYTEPELDYSFRLTSFSETTVHTGETTTVNLIMNTADNKKISDYTSKVTFTVPEGLRYAGLGSSTTNIGKISYDNETKIYTWSADFVNTASVGIFLLFEAKTAGTYTLTFTGSGTPSCTSKRQITVEKPDLQLTPLYDTVQTRNNEFVLEFDYESTNLNIGDVVVMDFSSDEYCRVSTAYGYDTETVKQDGRTVTFTNNFMQMRKTTLGVYLTYTTAGVHTFTVMINGDKKTYTIYVKPDNVTKPYLVAITLDEYEIDRLGDGKTYTVSSMIKPVIDTENLSLYQQYDYNYRIGVFNSPVTADYTTEEYLELADWSSTAVYANTENECAVDFEYNAEAPVVIFITGEYLEAEAKNVDIQYTFPVVMEKQYMTGLEKPGIFPYPVKQLPVESSDYCTISLNSNVTTNRLRLYDCDMRGLSVSEDSIVQGITIDFNYTTDNPVSLLAKMIIHDNETGEDRIGQRSINLTGTGQGNLGGQFDLWGLEFEDFLGEKLDNIEIELTLLNPFTDTAYLELNNFHITFYYIDVQESVVKCWVNGKDVRYYNIFLENITVPAGTENEVKYLNVDGTDSTVAYRSNIQKKKIKIKFMIPGCDINETSQFLERVGKLFSNERDKFNKPILNTIEFSNYPDRVWYFLMEDAIDTDVNISDYEGTIELVVPSGTSEAKTATVTNSYGVNNSIAKINPTIFVQCTSTELNIREEETQQDWTLRNTDDDSYTIKDKLIRIDCANRKAYIVQSTFDETGTATNNLNDIDVTKGVDFNSDWFIVYGEYSFNCNNTGNIQSISFHERW